MSQQRLKKKGSPVKSARLSPTARDKAEDSRATWPWTSDTTGAMTAIMLGAFVIRFGVSLAYPNIQYPDEIYQVTEQAHRIVFGTGLIPWEFAVGARSWLFPGIIAVVMEIARIVHDTPGFINGSIAAFMTALSLTAVACGFLWGHKVAGTHGAIVAGVVTAIWAELIYFSPHPLSDVIAGNLLVVAIYLGYPDGPAASARRLFWAGIFFGLTFALRLQLAPAIAVAVIWICRGEIRTRWIALVAGALIPVVLSELLDLLTWHTLASGLLLNAWLNLDKHIATGFGEVPRYWLAHTMWTYWGWGTALIVAGLIIGGIRLPLLLVTAVVIFVTQSCFRHQEYRFMYPAMPLIATLLGIAVVEISRIARDRWKLSFNPAVDALAGVAIWCVVSYSIASSAAFTPLWYHGSGELAAYRAVSARPRICGVGLVGISWLALPGYSHLRSGVTIYQLSPDLLNAHPMAVNALIVPSFVKVNRSVYRPVDCFLDGSAPEVPFGEGRVCLWIRSGGCVQTRLPAPPINWPPALWGHQREWLAR